MIEIEGEKGTCFLEDTYGFHKGVTPKSKIRLLFQVQYSLNPIFGYDYIPAKVTAPFYADFNSYVNRLFVVKS